MAPFVTESDTPDAVSKENQLVVPRDSSRAVLVDSPDSIFFSSAGIRFLVLRGLLLLLRDPSLKTVPQVSADSTPIKATTGPPSLVEERPIVSGGELRGMGDRDDGAVVASMGRYRPPDGRQHLNAPACGTNCAEHPTHTDAQGGVTLIEWVKIRRQRITLNIY